MSCRYLVGCKSQEIEKISASTYRLDLTRSLCLEISFFKKTGTLEKHGGKKRIKRNTNHFEQMETFICFLSASSWTIKRQESFGIPGSSTRLPLRFGQSTAEDGEVCCSMKAVYG